MKMDRRQLGKRLAGGVAATLFGAVPAFAETESAGSGGAGTVWVQVHTGIWKTTFGKPEDVTPVSSRLVPPAVEALRQLPATGQPPISAPEISVTPRGVRVSLPLAPQEEVFGLGLQFFTTRHRGRKRVMRVNADPKADTGDSHAPVPFYVTSRGYGVLVDTTRYATFYCGEARDKPRHASASVQSVAIATSTDGLYSKALEPGHASQVLVDVPSARGVDIYLFAGPTALDAVRRYNLFSGGGVAPPEWGLGFWYRVAGNSTGASATRLMHEFRSRNIPCDVVGLESGWQTHAYSCTFTWSDRFPQPAEFVKQMKALDLHVNLWEHAFTHPASPLFSSLLELSGDKGVWGGLVPDFQDPKARQVFGNYQGKTFIDLGVDGFKLDECDNSDYTGSWSFPEMSRFPSGVDGEQMHSLFGLRYQMALWDQFKQRNLATYSLVRSSGALAAPYPFVLYSDLYDHRQFVRALVNSGFSGLLWCPEVRDAKSEEDLLRRMQSVVFSPMAMINGWYIPNPPWKQLDRKKNNAGELTTGWESLEVKCREIVGWRMQMVPYLMAAFEKYAADGTPPFRALILDWPERPKLADVDDAWMVGDRMLVAPLFAGEPGRKLQMPPGEWYDFWTGKAAAGDSVLDIPASHANIPLFVKAGSVIPVATVTNSVAETARRKLTVKVYGDGQLPFQLKTTDGTTLRLTWSAGKGRVQSTGPQPFSVTQWTIAG